jgi:hypothetical protein
MRGCQLKGVDYYLDRDQSIRACRFAQRDGSSIADANAPLCPKLTETRSKPKDQRKGCRGQLRAILQFLTIL